MIILDRSLKKAKGNDVVEKLEEKKVEKKSSKMKEGNVKRNSKKKIIIITAIVILILCLIFSTAFALTNSLSDGIIKGVSINGMDVSGYEKAEIDSKLKDLIEENKTKSIILKYEETEQTITPEDLSATYNVEKAVEEAFLIGRKDNIFINNFDIIQSYMYKKNIPLEYRIDEEKLDDIINTFNNSLPGIVKQYNYSIEEDELLITKGVEGIAVKKEELKKEIKKAIINLSTKDEIVEAEVETIKPDEIDLEKIHSEIYREPEDAYISENPKTVHPNVNGVDFAISMEEAKALLEEDKEEYIIPLKISVASVTLSDLGREAFPNELGSYSTRYNVSSENRSTNVRLAAEKINGTIILPGETFSYNQTVGKRTVQAGFREAGAYLGGTVVQEVGGGICQVSSTLYNAALYANLEIVERHNHHFESSYVDASRDATVSWGGPDFRFKNNRTYPIRITASARNGVNTVTISGIKEETEYEVVIQSKRLSTINRETKYEDDNNLESGKEEIIQSGHDGCVSEAYKIVRLNGETISSTRLSRDSYAALDRIIKRGTKAVEEKPASVTEEEGSAETNAKVEKAVEEATKKNKNTNSNNEKSNTKSNNTNAEKTKNTERSNTQAKNNATE